MEVEFGCPWFLGGLGGSGWSGWGTVGLSAGPEAGRAGVSDATLLTSLGVSEGEVLELSAAVLLAISNSTDSVNMDSPEASLLGL